MRRRSSIFIQIKNVGGWGGWGVGGLGVVWVGGGGEILGNVSKFVLSVEFVLKCPLKAISIYTAGCLW